MLFLFETAAGFALYKLLDSKKLKLGQDALAAAFADAQKARDLLKLKDFSKFEDTDIAVEYAAGVAEGRLPKSLKKFLKTAYVKKGLSDKLAVIDPKLGNLIQSKLDIKCKSNDAILEVMKSIRQHMKELTNMPAKELDAMTLGLSHSLSRFKIKFSPEKVDVMIIQAIALLDEVDKELNTYAMRVKEWFGWHFPEMVKIVKDNLQYAQCVIKMGTRENVKNLDFSDILEEDVDEQFKEAAKVSMGTGISDEDELNIKSLADQVVSLSQYRESLFKYLKDRMNAIAPNLSVMVGELVGARLIAHAGSLIGLAKHPASTVQILGAEKALFRALKTKHETPKYGLIYHASLVGQAAPKHKGKISRVLAAKCSLAARVDALGDEEGPTIAIENRDKVERRLAALEGRAVHSLSNSAKKEQVKYEKSATPVRSYNDDADTTVKAEKKKKKKKIKTEDEDVEMEDASEEKKDKKSKKKDKKSKKKKKRKLEETEDTAVNGDDAAEEPKKKKKKKDKKDKSTKKKDKKSKKKSKKKSAS